MRTPDKIDFDKEGSGNGCVDLVKINQISLLPSLDHWVVQLQEVPASCISDATQLSLILRSLAKLLELRVVSSHAHHFGPGASAVLILSESHLSAHTWPEKNYVHLDMVICSPLSSEALLETATKECFQTTHVKLTRLQY